MQFSPPLDTDIPGKCLIFNYDGQSMICYEYDTSHSSPIMFFRGKHTSDCGPVG